MFAHCRDVTVPGMQSNVYTEHGKFWEQHSLTRFPREKFNEFPVEFCCILGAESIDILHDSSWCHCCDLMAVLAGGKS